MCLELIGPTAPTQVSGTLFGVATALVQLCLKPSVEELERIMAFSGVVEEAAGNEELPVYEMYDVLRSSDVQQVEVGPPGIMCSAQLAGGHKLQPLGQLYSRACARAICLLCVA